MPLISGATAAEARRCLPSPLICPACPACPLPPSQALTCHVRHCHAGAAGVAVALVVYHLAAGGAAAGRENVHALGAGEDAEEGERGEGWVRRLGSQGQPSGSMCAHRATAHQPNHPLQSTHPVPACIDPHRRKNVHAGPGVGPLVYVFSITCGQDADHPVGDGRLGGSRGEQGQETCSQDEP